MRDLKNRPTGVSSRVHRTKASAAPWTAANGQQLKFPIIVDIGEVDSATHTAQWLVEATVDLIDHEPTLVDIRFQNQRGINPISMSRDFRWGSPVEIVRRILPELLEQGIDIWSHNLPLQPLTELGDTQGRLTDEFLRSIAHQYLELGPDYARIISLERGVSSRTVVGWIQKARKRGILSGTTRGHVGGSLSE